MERCSSSAFPNYNYEQNIAVVEVYRLPKTPRPSHTEALQRILQLNREQQITTVVARDLNINSWETGFQCWAEAAGLWELTNLTVPTFKADAVDDAILMAAGQYVREGIISTEDENTQDQEKVEFYPVYVTEARVVGEHMALFDQTQSVRSSSTAKEASQQRDGRKETRRSARRPDIRIASRI